MAIQQLRVSLLALTMTAAMAVTIRPAYPASNEDAATLTASEIANASVTASGGKALDAVNAVRRVADIHIEGDMFGALDGSWEIAFELGRNGYQKADFGSAATTIWWDGTAGWEESAMGVRELRPEEIELNRWLWELSFLHALKRDSTLDQLSRVDDETLAESLHYVLEYTSEAGAETRIFVDSKTWLISRLTSTVELPMIGASPVMTEYFDYQDEGGLMLPQSTHQRVEGLWDVKSQFTETEFNPALEEGLFAPPSER